MEFWIDIHISHPVRKWLNVLRNIPTLSSSNLDEIHNTVTIMIIFHRVSNTIK